MFRSILRANVSASMKFLILQCRFLLIIKGFRIFISINGIMSINGIISYWCFVLLF